MLDDKELEQLMVSHGISKEGQQIVWNIRKSKPARRVESSKKSVACRYPSRKMRGVIQAESHTNELAAVHTWEHDPNVYEFWDQPPTITLRYRTANGRKTGAQHTADYFLISQDFIGWVECKQEDRLKALSEKQPGRYVLDGDTWRCPPGEEYGAKYGLGYRVRSSTENDWILIRNLTFLENYWKPNCPTPTKKQREVVNTLFSESPWMSLSALLKADAEALPADAIYKLIVDGDLYFDIRRGLISDSENALVFRDEISAEAYKCVLPPSSRGWQAGPLPVSIVEGAHIGWDGKRWEIINVGDKFISLVGSEGNHRQLKVDFFENLVRDGQITGLPEDGITAAQGVVDSMIRAASKAEMAIAIKRSQILRLNLSCPSRTLRELKRRFREADKTIGNGFVGLLPKISQRGNRLRKVDPDSLELLKKIFEDEYAKPKRISEHSIYGVFVNMCAEKGLPEISEKTFHKEANKLKTLQLEKMRMGDKAAYPLEPFYWSLESSTPRHGERPFEIAHVDHTLMDVELVHPITGEPLGRPWLTLLIDAFTRMVLAYVISFDQPNYVTLMMVFRECVRRHQRIPKTLVVDGGSDFKSTYFECLLARLHITKKTRPPAKSRYGSVMERMFGVANSEFIHELAGNTQATREPRSCSATHNPKKHAVWTLRDITGWFEQWVDHYHKRTHTALGTSPEKFLTEMNARCGERLHERIPYTKDFEISCLPEPKGKDGKVTVNSVRGIKVQGTQYWHPDFQNRAMNGKRFDAKIDPFNQHHIFVYFNNKWTECYSGDARNFINSNAATLQIGAEESKAFRAQEPAIRKQRVQEIARFHSETAEIEKDLALRREQAIDSAAQDVPVHEDTEMDDFKNAWTRSNKGQNQTVYKDF